MSIARRKPERATSEIEELAALIEEKTNLEENKARLEARFDPISGNHQIYISEVPNLDSLKTDISITVGIIAHLLRSCLDNLVYELALVNSQNNISHPRRIQFPIVDCENDYQELENRCLSEISSEHRRIIASFQPFHGIAGRPDSYSGSYIHQLTLLREISNSDKHREVVAVLVDPNTFQFTKEATPIFDAFTEWRIQHLEEPRNFEPPEMRIGEIIVEAVKIDEYDLDQPAFAGYGVAKICLKERRPAIPALKRIEKYVRLIVDELQGR